MVGQKTTPTGRKPELWELSITILYCIPSLVAVQHLHGYVTLSSFVVVPVTALLNQLNLLRNNEARVLHVLYVYMCMY